jgi:hypothetical protein
METPEIDDWLDPDTQQTAPRAMDVCGVRIESTRGRAREVREMLAFAEALAVFAVEHHVISATYTMDTDGVLTCHVVIRSGAHLSEVDRIHRVAGLTLSCWTDGDTQGRHRGRVHIAARNVLVRAMMISPRAYDPSDLGTLAAAANDESGRAEMTNDLAALLDRVLQRLTAVQVAMQAPAPP